jgi:hypothetical protein
MQSENFPYKKTAIASPVCRLSVQFCLCLFCFTTVSQMIDLTITVDLHGQGVKDRTLRQF